MLGLSVFSGFRNLRVESLDAVIEGLNLCLQVGDRSHKDATHVENDLILVWEFRKTKQYSTPQRMYHRNWSTWRSYRKSNNTCIIIHGWNNTWLRLVFSAHVNFKNTWFYISIWFTQPHGYANFQCMQVFNSFNFKPINNSIL